MARYLHTMYRITDPERSRTFYEALGFTFAGDFDIVRNGEPVWAKTSKADRVFFVRMNNSSRPMPPDELQDYFADRWPELRGAFAEA